MSLTVPLLLAVLAALSDVGAVPLAADTATDLPASSTSPGSTVSGLNISFSVDIPGVSATSLPPTASSATETTTASPSNTSTQPDAVPTTSPDTSSSTLPPSSIPATTSSPAVLPSGTWTAPTPWSTGSPDSTYPTSPISSLLEPTTTIISTVYLSPNTVTTTAAPVTVTETITIIQPSAPSPTVEFTTWAAPPQMTDLRAFNIANFASGQRNMHIVVSDSLPPPSNFSAAFVDPRMGTLSEAAIAVQSAVAAGIIPPPPGNGTSSFLQLFYPANSINPAQEPRGGAEFYARPLDLSNARNVSLEYSVFFPSNFDFVKGGKLPGFYGGHDGCSGGDDATKCFSTRLMWRAYGTGELYLYAPKDKQTVALCNTPPESVCDSEYGLSIGRKSFKFAAGNWTHVKQTVLLNTPGEHDGCFTLEVDKKPVIDRCDVYYRGVSSLGSEDPTAEDGVLSAKLTMGGLPVQQEMNVPKGSPGYPKLDSMEQKPLSGFTASASPPTLGMHLPLPAVQNLTPVLRPGHEDLLSIGLSDLTSSLPVFLAGLDSARTIVMTTTVAYPTRTITVVPTSTQTAYAMEIDGGMSALELTPRPVGFTGLFFSTFFGGHEQVYATPKDQFTWFKEFAMAINA